MYKTSEIRKYRTQFNGYSRTNVITISLDSQMLVIKVAKPKYRIKVISGRPVTTYPLTLDERVRKADQKLARMTPAERWELVEKSFGMWNDYPEDVLERIRNGSFHSILTKDSTLTTDVALTTDATQAFYALSR